MARNLIVAASSTTLQTMQYLSNLHCIFEYKDCVKFYWFYPLADEEDIKNENACVSHLPRVDGVQKSPNNFDLNPVTLTYDLELRL